MGYAPGKGPNCLHLLGVKELGLYPVLLPFSIFAFGNICYYSEARNEPAVRIIYGLW